MQWLHTHVNFTKIVYLLNFELTTYIDYAIKKNWLYKNYLSVKKKKNSTFDLFYLFTIDFMVL